MLTVKSPEVRTIWEGRGENIARNLVSLKWRISIQISMEQATRLYTM